MAGAGYKLFNTGDVLTAAQVNTYLQEQVVMVFANSTARTTALSSVLAEGMMSYLQDTDLIQYYNGSTWVTVNTDQTPLTTKGDLFTFTTSDARLAVGNNGETLVADSSATTGLRWQGDYAAGKNKIINGDFGIWQRGTSFSAPASTIYTADRWFTDRNGTGATVTVSQQTFTPATAPVSGYEGTYFYRFNQSVAGSGGSFNVIAQRIEDVRVFAGQTATFSFWAKAASTITLPSLEIYQDFGSGGSGGVQTSVATNVSIGTSWTRYSYTVAIPSISGKTIGTGSNNRFTIYLPINATFTFDLWGCQLEAGNVATAFQTATGTLAGELAACQRYYELNVGTVFLSATNGGFGNSYTGAVIYRVTKRSTPTLTIFSGASQTGTSGSATWYTGGAGTVATATVESNETTQFSLRQTGNNTYGITTFSYTSSAEL